jgi:ribosomal silencing factor RsfS
LLTPFKTVSKELKDKPWHVEVQTMRNGCDYVNVVVHVFQTQIREYYNIENCGRCKNHCNKTNTKKRKKNG